jgi:hypothetical protein
VGVGLRTVFKTQSSTKRNAAPLAATNAMISVLVELLLPLLLAADTETEDYQHGIL